MIFQTCNNFPKLFENISFLNYFEQRISLIEQGLSYVNNSVIYVNQVRLKITIEIRVKQISSSSSSGTRVLMPREQDRGRSLFCRTRSLHAEEHK